MYEQLPKGKQKPLVEEESNFLDWALIKVPQGELRMNYYKLLKQYRKENVKLVKLNGYNFVLSSQDKTKIGMEK